MKKSLNDLFKRVVLDKHEPKANLKKVLSDKTACYVLIYCDEPRSDGSMNVELMYEGDRSLAAYLLHSAQGALD